MSLITYILESCDGSQRYKINFTGATYLNVGDVWDIECGDVLNGCYNVLENTDESLENVYGDECIFIEYNSCGDCEASNSELLAGPSVAVNRYVECSTDDRPPLDDGAGGTITVIDYPTTSLYSGSQSILFRDDLFNYHCFELSTSTTASPTDGITAVTGFTNCTNCVSTCEAQDIVILIDQSGSVGSGNWPTVIAGVVEIANNLQDLMDLGLVSLSAYKWSACDNVDLISNLTSNHTNFVNAVNAATYDGGSTYLTNVLDDAYNQLTGVNANDSANKTIIVITDGGITDYSSSNCDGSDIGAVQMASQMKLGIYGSAPSIKFIAVNLVSGYQSQLISIASGSDNYFSASTFSDWQTVVSDQVSDESCVDNPYLNDGFDYYLATACCDFISDVYVAVDSTYTVNSGDGFYYLDNCYEFSGSPSNSFSGDVITIVDNTDIVSNICTSCDCSFIKLGLFRNCCIYLEPLYIPLAFNSNINPPSVGMSVQFSGQCFELLSLTGGTEPLAYVNVFDEDCDKIRDLCPDCDPPSNSQTPTPTITPTISVTPTITPTITLTPTITPTASGDPSYEYRQIRTCCPNKTSPTDYVLVNLRFDYGTAPNVGQIIHFGATIANTPSCGTVISDGVLTGTDSAGWTAHTSCTDCLGSNDYFCSSQFWLGCGTGEIYNLFDLTDGILEGEINSTSGFTITGQSGDPLDDSCLTPISGVSVADNTTFGNFSSTGYTNCSDCLGTCNPQDMVILMDQSGSVGSSNWESMKDGVIEIANGLQSRMDLGEVRLGAIRWSNCSSTSLVQSLTSNHTTFTSTVDTAAYAGGGTYASQALSDAYDMLSVGNLSAEKTIILITDGGIADFNNVYASCPSLSTSQLANQMKAGLYGNGIPIKIYTVNITNGNNLQLNSLSSGPEFQFSAVDFDDFVYNVSSEITNSSCEENPISSGDTYDFYLSSPCCTSLGLSDIIVAVNTATTVTTSTDGFIYNGSCYTLDSLTGDSFSAQTVYTVLSGDVVSNVCSESICDCNNFERIFLRNCCDSDDKISILYSGTTPSVGGGLEYSGNCYYYEGTDTTGTDVGITTNTLISDICNLDYCGCVGVSNTPTQTVTPTTTPTISVTPSITTTPDSSATPSPTTTPTISVTPSITTTPDSSATPSITVTPSITTTPDSTVTSTPSVTATPTITPSSFPDCASGTTTGNYRFTDCCGVVQIGSSIGKTFCVDTTLFYDGISPTSLVCDQECDEGPLSVTTSLTGACDSNGAVLINVLFGTKPYYVENVTSGDTQSGNGPDFLFEGLSEGYYEFLVYDSSNPSRESSIFLNISPCFDAEISNFVNAECGNDNGSLTISGNSVQTLPYQVDLYVSGNSTPLLQTTMQETTQIFNQNISPDESYYAILTDSEGFTAQTQTVTISSTTSVSFGVVITGSSSCNSCSGIAQVTGVTGTPPFTYTWGNGATGDTVTGLCVSDYSVIVEDSNGCSSGDTISIPEIPPLGVSSYSATTPSCFNCDGEITINVTGGTSPYNFTGSNSQQDVGNDTGTFTLTGLCGGQYDIVVTDNFGCTLKSDYTLNSSSGINTVSITPKNSDCSKNGSIQIDVEAIVGSITYTITGSSGDVQTTTTNNQTHTFNNLDSDTYTIGVLTSNGCLYTDEVIIENEDKFTISYTGTNASCGVNNGSIDIEVLTGTTEIKYPLSYVLKRISDGTVIFSNVGSVSNTQTITNILDGNYELIITDNESCSVTEYVGIEQEGDGLQAIVYGTPCIFGDDGTATIQITNGTAPFLISWSNNVPEAQRSNLFLSELSGGTYIVTIFDSNGCALQKSVTISCDVENLDNYVVNTLCEQTFDTTSQNKRGFYEMLNEAFLDLNLPGYDCYLESAIFRGVLTISGGSYGGGITYEEEFYTGYTLNDVPSDNDWENVVNNLLSNYTGFTYETNIFNNTFTLVGNCDGDEDPTNGAHVELRAEIDLDVNCIYRVPPSPTPTPSITPTISVTPTITPTISITPSITPTNTPSLSPGASTSPTPTITTTPTITVTPSITPTITPTPTTIPIPKALLFILEQKNNAAFAQYMYDNGSTFYGFAYNSQPSIGTDITLFMDWPGWFDGTAPEVIQQEVPQVSGGVDSFGNNIVQYNFLTTQVPKGTSSSAWYIWLIPQSQIGDSDNRQTYIEYNVNSLPNSFVGQPMTSSIYEIPGSYSGSNWVGDTYRMYTTHPGQAFSITHNDVHDIFFRGALIS